MYFLASERIAHERPDLASAVLAVDAYFRDIKSSATVTSNLLSQFIPLEDANRLETVLDLLAYENELERFEVVSCTSRDQLFRVGDVPERTDGPCCNLCGGEGTVESCKVIWAFKQVRRDNVKVLSKPQVVIDGLMKMYSSVDAEPKADIVFLHGLTGTWDGTWMNGAFSFPIELGKAVRTCDVYATSMLIPLTHWLNDSLALQELSREVAEQLRLGLPSQRPLLLIGHSMGGLVAKQVARFCEGTADTKYRAVLEKIRGFEFLATPHGGSQLGTWAAILPRLVRKSKAVKQLEHHNGELRDINDWFRGAQAKRRWSCNVLYESQRIRPGLPILRYLNTPVLVVDPDSADPGLSGVTALPISDADHISIAKPASVTSKVFVMTVDWIRQLV